MNLARGISFQLGWKCPSIPAMDTARTTNGSLNGPCLADRSHPERELVREMNTAV